MKILVIDIGGSAIKFQLSGEADCCGKFPSGKSMTPTKMLDRLLKLTQEWEYDSVSIGYPAPVIHGKPAIEPKNLGKGWLNFDFESHFKKPVKIMNDAAMQALGNYRGGRMLFIGLGTGLGSALILDDIIVPLELGELSYSSEQTLEDVLSKKARNEHGKPAWESALHKAAVRLQAAFKTDYLVIGGGGAEILKRMPKGTTRSSNAMAFRGGERLWAQAGACAHPLGHTWIIA